MTEWIVPLAAPRLRDRELQALLDGYRSGWWTMGPRTERLEAEMRDYTGAAEAVAVSSCTAALHLACLGAGIGPGDSVVVPSMTFAATVNVVASTGARPVFAEIVSVTEPWLDPVAVEAELNRGATAVISVAYGGHPGEVAELVRVCKRHGATLIEDVAHAAGSWHRGRHLGTLGRFGALSFSASKNLGIGEGGMLLSDDPVLAGAARRSRWQGITASTADRHDQPLSSYDVAAPGLNYRFDDPRAAAVSARLGRLDRDNEDRARIADAYRDALAGDGRMEPTAAPPPGDRNSHCMFTAVVADGIDRDHVRVALAERGVQTSLHFPPLHLSTAYQAGPPRLLPMSEEYARRSITLPLFPEMEESQLALVLDSLPGAMDLAERRRPA